MTPQKDKHALILGTSTWAVPLTVSAFRDTVVFPTACNLAILLQTTVVVIAQHPNNTAVQQLAEARHRHQYAWGTLTTIDLRHLRNKRSSYEP